MDLTISFTKRSKTKFGWKTELSDQGLIVKSIDRLGVALRNGLIIGDLIYKIEDNVSGLSIDLTRPDLETVLQSLSKITVHYRRNDVQPTGDTASAAANVVNAVVEDIVRNKRNAERQTPDETHKELL